MKNLFPILFAVVVISSGCDPDGYSCNSDGCYEDNDNPQYQTLEDCNSMCDEQIPGGCGSPVLHDGYLYSTVQIGEQCWFAENCRYLPSVSPSYYLSESVSQPRYYVYAYEGSSVEAAMLTNNYETYGVLYNWPAVMTEGVCPSGWHIPSKDEFIELENFLGEGSAVFAMKSTSGWSDMWGDDNNGSNSSGFTALPGGKRTTSSAGDFWLIGTRAYWWSSTTMGLNSGWSMNIPDQNDNLIFIGEYNADGLSARCIRD